MNRFFRCNVNYEDLVIQLVNFRGLLRAIAIVSAIFVLASAAQTYAQEPPETLSSPGAAATADGVRPVRTDSPRMTISTLRYLANELERSVFDYRNNKSPQALAQVDTLFQQLMALIDTSTIPAASRQERGMSTVLALLDIEARMGLPDEADIPDAEAFADTESASWRLPNTPLRLIRMEDGPHLDEFLFSGTSARAAPRFASTLTDEAMDSDLEFSTWSRGWPQITGPMIPADIVRGMPENARFLWHGTPIWKVMAVVAASGVTIVALAVVTLLVWPKGGDNRSRRIIRRLLPPLITLAAISGLDSLFDEALILSGDFAGWVGSLLVVATYGTLAWLFWVVVTGIFNWSLNTPEGEQETLNASLLKLGARIIGGIGILVILGVGATRLGLPVVSVVAGLGVSSLAVALAVRPSLENLIGGVVLFADKPVRVGDFCSFGSHMGTVEAIGIRSTQIRGLDRTRIAVPNAKFADMEIINWAQCDRMLINETIGLRYETRPDQLRYVLRNIRAMVHAHPSIESDTIRVRFTGYGESSLKIGIRIYAKTREWNAFYAIQEDVFLRIYEIVEEAGTDFAVPASRLYVNRDVGLDRELTDHAVATVAEWREGGTLPFPFMSEAQVRDLSGTVSYPPPGSVELGTTGATRRSRAENLSEADGEDEEAARDVAR